MPREEKKKSAEECDGTVGIGESGGAVSHCIIPSAIYNAIGKYVDDEPVTPDKVLKALG